MLLDILLLIVGLLVLYFGAEAMVKGASLLALKFGISPLIVGLTVVAFGTSAPEFVVSLIAALQESQGLSVGNIVGSNICNIALILGASAMIAPLAVDAGSLRREYPIMFAAMLLFYLVCLDGEIAWWEGSALFAGLLIFVGYNIWMSRQMRQPRPRDEDLDEDAADQSDADLEVEMPNPEEAEDHSNLKNVLLVIFGIAGLTGGAHLMVESSRSLALAFGISDFVIGITIVAFGTSLPELATSAVAAFRNQSDISIGNVVGSNIFNVLFVMGVIPMILEMPVSSRALSVDFPVMLGVVLIAFPLLRFNYRLTRPKAAVLLVIYVGYMAFLFANPGVS